MVDLIIKFDTVDDYEGEFGFDGVKFVTDEDDDGVKTTLLFVQNNSPQDLEYVYDDTENKYLSASENEELQQKLLEEYPTFTINEDDPYYVPYLSMFPNQEIELMMLFTILDDIEMESKVITFEHNDSYLVTIDGQTNENIRYTPKGKRKEITIKCLKPSQETYIIAKDEKNNIIGKICAKDNTAIYNLNIRVICVVEDTPKKDEEVDQLVEQFKNERIEEYLNHKSLNQALIKTKVEVDKKYRIVLDESHIKNMQEYLENGTPENTKAMFDKLSEEYRNHFETGGEKFKGILFFINYIDFPTVDATFGATKDINSRKIVVFKPGLSDRPTFAHEIGHALGLQHFFLSKSESSGLVKDSEKFEDLNAHVNYYQEVMEYKEGKIAESEWYINEYQNEINTLKLAGEQDEPETASKIENLEADIEKAKNTNAKREHAKREAEQNHKAYEKRLSRIQSKLDIYKANRYRFKRQSSCNMMDYSYQREFMHWQWLIMQNNIKNSKGTVS